MTTEEGGGGTIGKESHQKQTSQKEPISRRCKAYKLLALEEGEY